jgi:hypothetical protein
MLTTVTRQSANVLMANAASQYPDMLQYCNALGEAAGNAEQAMPIPDRAMQARYAAALRSFRHAARDCTAGIHPVLNGDEDTEYDVHQTDLKLAITELRAGESQLYTATEMLRRQ